MAKKYIPDTKTENRVRLMASAGIPHHNIAKALELNYRTLKEYYGDVLKSALDELNSNVAGALYKNAMKGNVAAQIFWLKTRAKWKEKQEVELSAEKVKLPEIKINIIDNEEPKPPKD